MPARKPTSLTIRTYQVGFGDCFLLSFKYTDRDRHVLIDFGSMALPKGVGTSAAYMKRIAQQIATDCGGKLDAVVATHRHRDHISGFRIGKDGSGPGGIIRGLKPDVVIQPWTEDPKAQTGATVPTSVRQSKAFMRTLAHTRTLQNMSLVAEQAVKEATAYRTAALKDLKPQLRVIGEDNISNPSAVKNLRDMAQKANYYVHFGSESGLERILPGVKTTVLGPPTLNQSDAIKRQRSEDPDEFWLAQHQFWGRQALAATDTLKNGALRFKGRQTAQLPPNARWFSYILRKERSESMLSIVRILDTAMNNTSVILLFECNGKSLLFPGDAQIENWEYALSQKPILKRLAQVDVYKVGHHGSRNATPKTLWQGFKRARASTPDLQSLMSTLAGVHGEVDAGTEVPRKPLTKALDDGGELLSTEEFPAGALRQPTVIRF